MCFRLETDDRASSMGLRLRSTESALARRIDRDRDVRRVEGRQQLDAMR